MIKKINLFIFLICISYNWSKAQTIPTVSQVTSELAKRGIPEKDFEDRLRSKGVNIEELRSDPKALVKYRTIIEATVAEFEAGGKIQADTIKKPQEIDGYDPYATIKYPSKKETIVIEKKEEKPTGHTIYGHQFFSENILKLFEKADEIKPREDYIIGPGDQIGISIWGASLYQKVFEVNAEGYIVPDNLPKILLKGLTYRKAKEVLRSRYQNSYSFNSGNFDVTLKFVRTVSVGIYGAVKKPGSYSISAANTAFNALVAAGGLSDIGSVRNIKLIRSGKKPATLDLYNFMANPNAQEDLYLMDNDIIQVSVAEKVVEVSGAVNIPDHFELTKDENLQKILNYCGGLKADAYRSVIQVKRFQNDKQTIIDVGLSDLLRENKDFTLLNGDIILINKITRPYENYVYVVGEMELPGQYAIESGLDLKKLLEKAKTTSRSRMDLAYLKRQNLDRTHTYLEFSLENIIDSRQKIELQNLDTIFIYSKEDFTNKFNITLKGAIRKPLTFAYDKAKNLKIRDAINLGEGLRTDASKFAYLTRIDTTNRERSYIRINLESILSDQNHKDNLYLEPNDEIMVYSELVYVDSSYIRISGAVKNPQLIPYGVNLNVKDLIQMAGGFKLEAAKNRIDVFRLLILENKPTRTVIATFDSKNLEDELSGRKQFELQPYDIVAVRTVPEFQTQRIVEVKGEVIYSGEYPIVKENQSLSDFVKMAGGPSKEAFTEGATLYRSSGGVGFVVIKLDEALKNNRSPQNIILKDGDILYIPKINDVVSIEGAINVNEMYKSAIIQQGNKINVAFAGTKNAKYYIEQYAGGFTEKSNMTDITVEYPNGRIKKSKNYWLYKSYPKVKKGSIIRVGYKKQKQLDKETKSKENTNWSKVVGDAVAQATAVLSLILLIRTINQ